MKNKPTVFEILHSHFSKATLIQTAKMVFHVYEHLQFRQFSSRFDREKASSEITAVILTVDPDPLFDQCLASVMRQDIKPAAIEIVRNVSPVSKARQEGLEKVHTPYYVNVDGDMILSPSCFKRLYFTMTRSTRCGEAEASLIDPLLGIIKGVKMYRSAPAKSIGFHTVIDAMNVDRYMSGRLRDEGYVLRDTHTIEGLHHPVYQPAEAFWKFRFLGKKIRYYRRPPEYITTNINLLLKHWRRTGDVIALYAMAGFFDGLASDETSQILSYEGRETYPPFLNIDMALRTSWSGTDTHQ